MAFTTAEYVSSQERWNQLIRTLDNTTEFYNHLSIPLVDDGESKEIFFRFEFTPEGNIAMHVYVNGNPWRRFEIKPGKPFFLERIKMSMELYCIQGYGFFEYLDTMDMEPFTIFFLRSPENVLGQKGYRTRIVINDLEGDAVLSCHCDMRDVIENLYLAMLNFTGFLNLDKTVINENWVDYDRSKHLYRHMFLYDEVKSEIIERCLYSGKTIIKLTGEINKPDEVIRIDYDYSCAFWDFEGKGCGSLEEFQSDRGQFYSLAGAKNYMKWIEAISEIEPMSPAHRYNYVDRAFFKAACLDARNLLPGKFDVFMGNKFPKHAIEYDIDGKSIRKRHLFRIVSVFSEGLPEPKHPYWMGRNPYLTLTEHPGKLTQGDIVNNITQMMENDYRDRGEEPPAWQELRKEALYFYHENIERIDEMAKPGEELYEATDGLDDCSLTLSFANWMLWEFPRTEWES